MSAQKKVYIPAMNENWKDFPWDKFSGGVSVTFVLVSEGGSSVALLRPTRWSYELPRQELSPQETVDDVLAVFNKQLKQMGIKYLLGTTAPAIIGYVEVGKALHLMVGVSYLQIGPVEKIELVSRNKAYQIKSGLALSNPVCEFVPSALGWESVETAENVPQTA